MGFFFSPNVLRVRCKVPQRASEDTLMFTTLYKVIVESTFVIEYFLKVVWRLRKKKKKLQRLCELVKF